MRMGADEVCAMGIVDEVLPEGEGGAHESPESALRSVHEYLSRMLTELKGIPGSELKRQRQERFARF